MTEASSATDAAIELRLSSAAGTVVVTISATRDHPVVGNSAVCSATKCGAWPVTKRLRQRSDSGSRGVMRDHRRATVPADALPATTPCAADQPDGVDVNEVVVHSVHQR